MHEVPFWKIISSAVVRFWTSTVCYWRFLGEILVLLLFIWTHKSNQVVSDLPITIYLIECVVQIKISIALFSHDATSRVCHPCRNSFPSRHQSIPVSVKEFWHETIRHVEYNPCEWYLYRIPRADCTFCGFCDWIFQLWPLLSARDEFEFCSRHDVVRRLALNFA